MPLPNFANSQILKKNLPLIIAAISALLAVVLINLYIRQQADAERKRLQELQKMMVTVVIAARDIPAKTRLSEEMLAEATARRDKIPDGIATSIGRVVDKYTTVAIAKGKPIFLANLAVPQKSEVWQSLATRIPPGKRAVTISVDEIASVAGMVMPGDYVDLVGMVSIPAADSSSKGMTTTLPLFQNTLVLAVGQNLNPAPGVTTKQEGGLQTNNTVTLALSPQEASIIAFISEQGKIRMVLRSPADKKSPRIIPADWDTVLKIILPQGPTDLRPKRTIEIYHGLQKETKTLNE
jgi:pilus assembly protein CpaB